MYKAVVFDFDYTLGDSTAGIAESVNYALENLRYEPKSVPEIKNTVGLSLKETFAALTGCRDKEQSERFIKLFREKADEVMTESTVLYDRVPEILRGLHKTIKTGIVSTKFRYRIEAILQKFGAEDLIDAIIGGEDVTREKPDQEGLLRALETLGVERHEVLYVGDSIVDAQTAQSANVDFAAVLTGTTTDFSRYKTVFIGDDMSAVFDFVTK